MKQVEILIKLGESQKVEFKEGISSSLAKEMVAFANAEGAVHDTAHDTAHDETKEKIKDMVQFCLVPRTASEMMGRAGLNHRMHFLKAYLKPALEKGLIQRTIPDKPKSKNQHYLITELGKETFNK